MKIANSRNILVRQRRGRITLGAFPRNPRSRASPRTKSRRQPNGSAVSTESTKHAAFSPATIFSATPFTPSGKKSSEEALFGWIVSDFGLNDAIESGLVKTPRVVIRDDAVPDAKTYKSRLYHLYNDPEVKDDLTRRAKPEDPMPDLVINGYHLLGYGLGAKTVKNWSSAGVRTPPVMITVANRTEDGGPD